MTPSYLNLTGVPLSCLPDPSASPDQLIPLLTSLLRDALPLVESAVPPARGWKPRGRKKLAGSDAVVALMERGFSDSGGDVDGAGGGGRGKGKEEIWACRRSVHIDEEKRGTAGWGEVKRWFKEGHVEAETKFMPSVAAAEVFIEWDCSGATIPQPTTTYTSFTLCAASLRHNIGRPVLRDRVFPILQMTCAPLDADPSTPSFLIVTIPIPDLLSSPTPTPTQREAAQRMSSGAITATYASVERFRKLSPQDSEAYSQGEGNPGDIEWIMATASDAHGVLPGWVQALAVPGQIAKDVPYFLRWVDGERRKKGGFS